MNHFYNKQFLSISKYYFPHFRESANKITQNYQNWCNSHFFFFYLRLLSTIYIQVQILFTISLTFDVWTHRQCMQLILNIYILFQTYTAVEAVAVFLWTQMNEFVYTDRRVCGTQQSEAHRKTILQISEKIGDDDGFI